MPFFTSQVLAICLILHNIFLNWITWMPFSSSGTHNLRYLSYITVIYYLTQTYCPCTLALFMAPSSSGLGHRPLTPGTGVRVPLGSPSNFKHLATSLSAFFICTHPCTHEKSVSFLQLFFMSLSIHLYIVHVIAVWFRPVHFFLR